MVTDDQSLQRVTVAFPDALHIFVMWVSLPHHARQYRRISAVFQALRSATLTGLPPIPPNHPITRAPASASAILGTWNSDDTDLMPGTWTEVYGPEGPGQPGAMLTAMADDEMQWSLGGIQIVEPATGEPQGDGTIIYTTDYYNPDDPGASYLMIAQAPTLWCDAANFTNLFLTVQATIDMDSGDYLGGAFTGTAGHDMGLSIEISGTLSETGDLMDPPGHEGTVAYIEVTITSDDPIELPLDIKPGSCPNAFNPRSHGVLPVALLGTECVDVMDVDLASLWLARADGEGEPVAPLDGPSGPGFEYEDVATPYLGEEPCGCNEMMGDGFMDLTMKFRTQMVVNALMLCETPNGTSVELMLTGTLADGTPFVAYDCIWIVGQKFSNPMAGGAGALGVR